MESASVDSLSAPSRHALFFQQWLKNPLRTASVAPSGRQLARLMAGALPHDARKVVELGAGTGAITRALLEPRHPPLDLLVVEFNPAFRDMLEHRFPQAEVQCGDACDLRALVAQSARLEQGAVDAVVSSLGLLAMPRALQCAILTAAFDVLKPGGVFLQYTYGLSAPLDDGVAEAMGLVCRPAGWAWRNLPPARVFVYSRP